MLFPDAVNPDLVGEYPGAAGPGAGGGFVWDEVVEYRVWCHPERGAPDVDDGHDYYYPFATYAEALEFSTRTKEQKSRLHSFVRTNTSASLRPASKSKRSRVRALSESKFAV
jgi:hypothetical protein